eukprot:CAMPEP_0178936426 /NCGR_PEP_ID=MMETSP0786-20121207/25174_1 /TAXON_ID=186022 /ORGANISM="Thalassionema frauenfeldii, Strain CCMP 1798" /LENGTH=855 /DNA_ID=CAMNT_0020614843 /DNA_START=373 /DNA_END=2940 /DNA_ORIENTATION=+
MKVNLESPRSLEHSERYEDGFDSSTSLTTSVTKKEKDEADSEEDQNIVNIDKNYSDEKKSSLVPAEYFRNSGSIGDGSIQQGDQQLQPEEETKSKMIKKELSEFPNAKTETSKHNFEKEFTGGDTNYERQLETQLVAMHGVIGQRKAEIARKRRLLAENRALQPKILSKENSGETEQLKKQLLEAHDEIAQLKSERQLKRSDSATFANHKDNVRDFTNEKKNTGEEGSNNPSSDIQDLEKLYHQSQQRIETLEVERRTFAAKTQDLENQLSDAMSELKTHGISAPIEEQCKGETGRETPELEPVPSDDTSTFLEYYTRPLNEMEQLENHEPPPEHEGSVTYEMELEEHYRLMVEQWEEAELQRAQLEDTKWLREQKLAGLQAMYTESQKVVSVLADDSPSVELKDTGTFDSASTEGPATVCQSLFMKTQKKNKQMKKSIKRLSQGLETANSKLFELLDEIEKSRERENMLRQEIRKLTQEKEKLYKELSKSNAILASVTASKTNFSNEKDEKLQSDLAQAYRKAEHLEKDLECQERKYQSELSILNKELEDSQTKISTLEKQFSRFIRKEPIIGLDAITGDGQEQKETKVAEFDNSTGEANDSQMEDLISQIAEKNEELRRREESNLMQADQIEELRERLHTALTNVSDLEFELRFNNAKIQELSQLNSIEDDEDDLRANLYEKSMQFAEVETKLKEAESKLGQYKETIDRLEQERSSNKNKVAELSTVWDSQAQIDAMRKELQSKALVIADHLNASLERIEELETEKNEYKDEAASVNMKLIDSMRRIEELESRLQINKETSEEENEMGAANLITDNSKIDDIDDNTKRASPLTAITTKNVSFTDSSSSSGGRR